MTRLFAIKQSHVVGGVSISLYMSMRYEYEQETMSIFDGIITIRNLQLLKQKNPYNKKSCNTRTNYLRPRNTFDSRAIECVAEIILMFY